MASLPLEAQVRRRIDALLGAAASVAVVPLPPAGSPGPVAAVGGDAEGPDATGAGAAIPWPCGAVREEGH